MSVPPCCATVCAPSRSWARKQHVVAGAFAELDVIAFVQGQTRACVCVLHYGGGTLQDKEYTFFHVTEGDPAEVLSAVHQAVLRPAQCGGEDRSALARDRGRRTP